MHHAKMGCTPIHLTSCKVKTLSVSLILMTSLSDATASLRRRISESGMSAPEIARRAGIRSANTVRQFMRSGNVQARTIAKIEAAVDSLNNSKGASARSDAHV